MKKKHLLYAILPALALAIGVTGVTHAATAPGTTKPNNPMNAIIAAIAQKFNLSSTDVQSVVEATMNAERAQMEANKQQAFASRLSQAVKDGKLSQAQADLITNKQMELKSFMDSLKDKTEAERQSAMKTEMDSLKQWATDNKIPAKYFMFAGGRGNRPLGHHKGFPGVKFKATGITNQASGN